jgi:excisionase family DNA binding protein
MAKPETVADCLVYDVPEAGALLGLSRNGSYEAAARGDLPVIRIGKLLKVPKRALEQMLARAGGQASV